VTCPESNGLSELQIRQLVESQSSKLTSYLYQRTGNLEVARDIVQETFLRLARLDRHLDHAHVLPWLYSVGRNLAIDYLRRQARWCMNGTEVIDHYCAEAAPNPLECAIHAETRDLLRECMDQLPPRHQEVMVLKFESGLSYREIASITRLSISNVGFIIHQSVARLRYLMVKMV
jgi:RNA polymerase sigma factor (sigma-70 family)